MFFGNAARNRTFVDDVVQLGADRAALCPGRRRKSSGLLPQERKASLHDAQDAAARRQSEGLHVSLGKVPLLSGRHLCCLFSSLQAGT
jgi:hypothetical protein